MIQRALATSDNAELSWLTPADSSQQRRRVEALPPRRLAASPSDGEAAERQRPGPSPEPADSAAAGEERTRHGAAARAARRRGEGGEVPGRAVGPIQVRSSRGPFCLS